MSATLIRTEALINDSDLCSHKNNKSFDENNGFESEDQIESEENVDLMLISDEQTLQEKQQMASLGLPQEFSSNKVLNKRSKKKTKNVFKSKSKSKTIINEDVNQSFDYYWLQFGYHNVCQSWYQKYPEYQAFYGNTSDDKSEELNNDLSSDEVIEENETNLLWKQLWDKHISEEYEIEFNKFVNNSQQVCDEFQFLPQMLTNINICDSDEQTCAQEEEHNNSSQTNERKPQEVNESISTSSGLSSVSFINSRPANSGSEGEEPPDERPTLIKRLHEYDSIDWNELNDEKILDQNEEKTVCLAVNKKRKSKYWHQRYRLFSRFDEGIKLDDESWYSVTPERIAEHIAHRFSNETNYIIIDAFCGSGGNTIQFALISSLIRIIAIDIDPIKIEFAKHNAHIYGVSDRIEFIIGDYMSLAKSSAFKVDAVFLSPPWGGPLYLREDKYKLNMMSPNGVDVFKVTQNHISPNIGFLLPRNIDRNELKELAGIGNSVEVEQNILNNKVKTVTAYFGNLIKSNSDLVS